MRIWIMAVMVWALVVTSRGQDQNIRRGGGVSTGGNATNAIGLTNGNGFGTTTLQGLTVTGPATFSGLVSPTANTNANGIVTSNEFQQLNSMHNWAEAANRTAPVGVNTWPMRGASTTANDVTNDINAIVANGMTKYYEYYVIDDGWQSATRNTNTDNSIKADATKYPTGITNVIAFIQSKGLKAGLYWGCGHATSGGFEGSHFTNVVLDANVLASWGIDYVRLETGSTDHSGDNPCRLFIKTLQSKWPNGRPVCVEGIAGLDPTSGPGGTLFFDPWHWDLFSLFPGGVRRLWSFDGSLAYYDFLLYLDSVEPQARWSVQGRYLGGYFYQPEALGYEEARSLASLFSIFSISMFGQASSGTAFTTNQNVYAILKDPVNVPGYSLSKSNNNTADVYVKPLRVATGGEVAAAFMNRLTGAVQSVTLKLTNIFGFTNVATAYDCWSNTWIGTFTNLITLTVPAHGCELLKVYPGKFSPLVFPNSYYASDLQWLGTATNNLAFPFDKTIVRDLTVDNNNPGVISINGLSYKKCLAGVGDAIVEFFVGGKVSTFTAVAGGDYANMSFTAPNWQCKVYADDVLIYTGKTISTFLDQDYISLDVTGANKIGIRIVNPSVAGGTANDRFVIAQPLFLTSRGTEVEWLRTRDINFNVGGFAPAAIFNPAASGPANSFYEEGFQLTGNVGYQWSISVPSWTQLVTFEIPVQVLAANVAWSNSIFAVYNPRNADGRVLTGGPYIVPMFVNNTATTLVFSVQFPATNTWKRLNWTCSAGSNSTARNFGSPWKVTYQ